MDLAFQFVIAAAVLLVLAILYRQRSGFGAGKTLSHDNLTLRSESHRLVGRPDRIVEKRGRVIIEDKKSSARVYDAHRLQMGFYMILAEEHFGS
jgi:membrane protein implicated in regulation of membrane protease activity